MRSKTCKQVVGWTCTGDSCNTCINNLNAFKNEKTDVIDLNKVDEEDLKKFLKQVFPGASQEMQDFLRSQHDILNSSKITWDKSVIKTCLSLWSRSVKCYEQLRDSNIFKLPSGRQLRRYKSSVEQKPGVSNDVLRWMRNTAIQVNVPPSGYHGGLLHDEAKIQEDLVLNVKGERSELVGWIDTGSEAENLRIVKENKVSRKLATDVLQITFLGYTGFRFPIAHYPTDGVKASELYIIIWDLISQLQSWGFIVDFIMQDGGNQNREFTKLHFTGEPRKNHFMCDSLVNPDRKVYHCQDFSHNMKKLRNAVFSS
ncbi:unnamed protein product [Mytilus edulis]|uniref:Transposable element P transposase-like RNase H domain-containing protein n=1 Tax=Mytilus edulis TaxID=6550 RepID=A0A8S3SGP2_MYTED|nr:unnamed protein product [Mytilus edulis]